MTDESVLEKARRALELEAKATAGPWRVSSSRQGNYWRTVDVHRPSAPSLEVAGEGTWADDDAEFIAAARTLLPDLARAVIEMHEELDTLDIKHKVQLAQAKFWATKCDEQREELTRLRAVVEAARNLADHVKARRARTKAFQEAASAARKGGQSGDEAIRSVEARHPVVNDISDLADEIVEAVDALAALDRKERGT